MGKRNRRRKDTQSQAVSQVIGEQQSTKKPLSEQIATRQRSIDFASILQTLPNPDPVLKKRGQAISVYEDITYDSRVQAVASSRKAPVKAKEWIITGEEDVPENVLEFYTEIFKTYNMTDIISEMLDSWVYGYKPFEILWKAVDGAIIPFKFIGKPPAWFKFDNDNNLRFLTSSNMISGEEVPPSKFIVAKNQATYANPYGVATMSSCFWPVTFRRTGMRFFTQFIEKYGSPFLVGHAEEGAQEDRISEMADMLSNMVQDAVAVVPQNWDIKLLEAAEGKGKSDSLHQNYLDVMNTEIAMSVLGQNLSTEVQGGSYAASKSHMTVRADIIESDTAIVENAFDELIKLTHPLNFPIGVPIPNFRLFSEEQVDKLRSERDLNLTKSGIRFNKNYYQRAYSLGEDEFELTNDIEQ